MATWLHAHPPTRAFPRLWVERVWLLESREPLVIIRKVDLHPGVNVVWAREPDSEEGSGLASAGHGVGKTSFCMLLRYLLGDEATAISTLREKAAANFAKGGVAAKVHIDGTSWLVYRPYGVYGHSLAKLGNQLEDLFEGQCESDFQTYLVSLQTAFIGRLQVQTLPGTNQPLEWRHLLAWCIRDQKTRFDGFFHWREGDGLGFRRSRQDPPLLVNSVLGILNSETDHMMRAVEMTQSELVKLEAHIPELERLPIYALDQLERQLRSQLKAGEDEPVFDSIVDMSLESRLNDLIANAKTFESQWEQEIETAEETIIPLLVKLGELEIEFDRLDMERLISKSLVDANEVEYKRLTTEKTKLNRLTGYCKDGLVDFSACKHIELRRTTTSLSWRTYEIAAKSAAPHLQSALDIATIETEAIKKTMLAHRNRVSEQRAALRRVQMQSATSAIHRERLKLQWNEFLLLQVQRKQGADSAELVRTKAKVHKLTNKLANQIAALATRKQQKSSRVDSLKALTLCLAERLLEEKGHGRFFPNSDSRPFDLSQGGEAYQVLEVLLGDITCLLDAATSNDSNHPGFLVHDCPREADMSSVLYKNFLMMVLEADEQLSCNGSAPFQYIVTTTSAPPSELCKAPYLKLELQPGNDDHLLFKRRLTTSLI